MDKAIGLLRIHIKSGIDLAIRDANSSDPYVLIRSGKQKLKTSVKKKCLNPVWNEDLTLCIFDINQPVKLIVYDKDTFTFDDYMGDADIDIKPFLDAINLNIQVDKRIGDGEVPNGTIISRVKPTRQNCLAEESHIVWNDGKLVQHMFLHLRNVERGEIELQLQWIDIPAPRDAAK